MHATQLAAYHNKGVRWGSTPHETWAPEVPGGMGTRKGEG